MLCSPELRPRMVARRGRGGGSLALGSASPWVGQKREIWIVPARFNGRAPLVLGRARRAMVPKRVTFGDPEDDCRRRGHRPTTPWGGIEASSGEGWKVAAYFFPLPELLLRSILFVETRILAGRETSRTRGGVE